MARRHGGQKEFFHYKALGDRTFEQLDTDQMNWKGSSESSSIGQIVKHLNGNMLSRWTDFLHSDGEKEGGRRRRPPLSGGCLSGGW